MGVFDHFVELVLKGLVDSFIFCAVNDPNSNETRIVI